MVGADNVEKDRGIVVVGKAVEVAVEGFVAVEFAGVLMAVELDIEVSALVPVVVAVK